MCEDAAFERDVRAVLAFVEAAAARGEGRGMLALVRRLEVLLVKQEPRETPRIRRLQLIEVTHSLLVWVLADALAPEVLSRVLAVLEKESEAATFPDDPWAPLDPEVSRARSHAARSAMLRAQDSAIQACGHYAATRRTSFLSDAVGRLETVPEIDSEMMWSRLSPNTCDREFERLGSALAGVLPRQAMAFLAQPMRELPNIAREIVGGRWTAAEVRRSDGWVRTGAWDVRPWTTPLVEGVWFEPQLQRSYEDEPERIRESRAAAAERARLRRQTEGSEAERLGSANQRREGAQAQDRGDRDRPVSAEPPVPERDTTVVVMDPAMQAAVEAELERRREQQERFAAFREEQRLARIEYDIKTGHVRQ
jgi:hypothetical protein